MPLPTLFLLSQKRPYQESLLLQKNDRSNQMDRKNKKEQGTQEKKTKKEEGQTKERTSRHIKEQVATILIRQTGGSMKTGIRGANNRTVHRNC